MLIYTLEPTLYHEHFTGDGVPRVHIIQDQVMCTSVYIVMGCIIDFVATHHHLLEVLILIIIWSEYYY